ncbi:MAG TPA: hypothetical protein EYN27_09320 [Rhodospirillales bacterium]|nr:hypothetical protein [Rhodospirillales bacterium]
MARKAMRRIDKNYQPPIPLDECKKIIKKVNSYERKKGVAQPFKNQDDDIIQLLFTIDLFNQTVDSFYTNPTLTPKNQKDFYNKLNKRVSRLLEFLQEEPYEYLERIYIHQMNNRTLEQRLKKEDEGLFGDITSAEPINPKKFINTLKAYLETIDHLSSNPINKNRKNTHRDDLRHLIDLLFEMYIKCSGRTPGYNYNKDKVYKGDFVLLVELVIPHVKPPFDIEPTNEAIGEGIKLCVKQSR